VIAEEQECGERDARRGQDGSDVATVKRWKSLAELARDKIGSKNKRNLGEILADLTWRGTRLRICACQLA
jgi:hypothetical protein